MFHNTEHEPQVLASECYTSEKCYEDELEALLLPAWHCVAALSDLAQEGDYRTLSLLGRPLLLWRSEGNVHAFLNVCSHRYAQLTSCPSGRLQQLKCQYHGWEYDCTGNTRCIPDAKSFRPLAPGVLGLRRFRCETAGQLVFVSLAPEGPSLAEYLGPGYDLAREWFHADLQPAIDWDREIDCNWKLPIENALESYHTTAVHPHTFGAFPSEEQCQHAFSERSTSMVVDYSSERSLRRWLDEYAHWNVGLAPRHRYEHHALYPNLMFARLSLYTTVESLLPLSPGRTLRVGRIFCHAGPRGRWWTAWMAQWIKWYGKSLLWQISNEDCRVLPDVQRGLESGEKPRGGLISTREERIVHFQRFIAAQTESRS
jgi:phenylpropionate dioxygenase-like ring-hydroxylating dioxygenase large terminal subunit